MWWDWTKITLSESILFSVLSLTILFLVGLGLHKLFSKLGKGYGLSESFDLLQKINLYLFFGFIALNFFLLVFSFTGLPFAFSTGLVILLAVCGFFLQRPKLNLQFPKLHARNIVLIVAVLFVALTILFSCSSLVTGYYGSTNDDGADHTSIVRLILDRPTALLRWGPQGESFPIGYTTGSHMLLAFLLTITDVAIQKVAILVGVFIPVLIAFAFYFTIQILFKNKGLSILGLIISGVLAVGYAWLPMSWGGLPVLLSLYICVSGMGLIYQYLIEEKMTWLIALFLGLIFFTASQTYPHALLVLLLWSLLILSAKLLPKLRQSGFAIVASNFVSKKNFLCSVAFIVPLLASFPLFFWLYSQLAAGKQLGSMSSGVDFFAALVAPKIRFDWLFDIASLSNFFAALGHLFAIVPLALVVLVALLVPRVSRWMSRFLGAAFARSLLLVYVFMLTIFAFLTITIYFNVNVLLAFLNSERTVQHLIIPAIMLSSVVLYLAGYLSYEVLKRLFSRNGFSFGSLRKRRVLGGFLFAGLVVSICALSLPVVSQQGTSYAVSVDNFSVYEVLNADDLALMHWIQLNAASSARILVSAGDSGQYVYGITQRHVVSHYTSSRNYTDLVRLLAANASDVRAVPYLLANNVSHVYVGSVGVAYANDVPFYRQFNATQFLSAPYFTVAKQVGNAYLFEFNQQKAYDWLSNPKFSIMF
jgi:hypothetical protein